MEQQITVRKSETSGRDSSWKCNVLGDGTLEIIDYLGNEKDVSIPSVIDGKSVSQIGEGAFAPDKVGREPARSRVLRSIESVIIFDGIKAIGSTAFYGCSSLKSLSVPKSITSVGESAFANCDSLQKVGIVDLAAWCTVDFGIKGGNPLGAEEACLYYRNQPVVDLVVPKKVKKLGAGVFSGYKGLETVVLPEGITSIGDRAFEACFNLRKVVMPEGITDIGGEAFFACIKLPRIDIPRSVRYIGSNAFMHCSMLMDASGLMIVNGVVRGADGKAREVRIPNGVRKIGENAFAGRLFIETIRIPESVTEIGEFAFKTCARLENIWIPDSVTLIADNAFEDVDTYIGVVKSITKQRLIIHANLGSYADRYAKEKGLYVVHD